ncbi:MAG: hypothetical protein R2726_08425 [Acidimicrobiales bacterium]
MATLAETIWVNNHAELESTVQRLVAQGGVVQNQTEDSVDLYLKKKMNVVVLVVGLILCLVPGLAYLIWYSTADQNQAITVKVGSAPTLGGYHPERDEDTSAPPPGDTGTAPGALPGSTGAPAAPIPPTPTEPVPAPPPTPPAGGSAPPMPPAPGETPPPPPAPPQPS